MKNATKELNKKYTRLPRELKFNFLGKTVGISKTGKFLKVYKNANFKDFHRINIDENQIEDYVDKLDCSLIEAYQLLILDKDEKMICKHFEISIEELKKALL